MKRSRLGLSRRCGFLVGPPIQLRRATADGKPPGVALRFDGDFLWLVAGAAPCQRDHVPPYLGFLGKADGEQLSCVAAVAVGSRELFGGKRHIVRRKQLEAQSSLLGLEQKGLGISSREAGFGMETQFQRARPVEHDVITDQEGVRLQEEHVPDVAAQTEGARISVRGIT